MLTALGKFGIKEITKLLNIIHGAGEISTDLEKSVYIAIPPLPPPPKKKKKGTAESDQHHTIGLLSHLTKVMLRVWMKRIRNKILPEISETQFGLMADKGTRYAIFSLIEATEVQKCLYLCLLTTLRHLTE